MRIFHDDDVYYTSVRGGGAWFIHFNCQTPIDPIARSIIERAIADVVVVGPASAQLYYKYICIYYMQRHGEKQSPASREREISSLLG